MRFSYFLEVFCHFDVVIVKFAFLLLYGRIFARRTFRRVLWMTAAAIMAWGIASVTVLIFQCRPLRRVRAPLSHSCDAADHALFRRGIESLMDTASISPSFCTGNLCRTLSSTSSCSYYRLLSLLNFRWEPLNGGHSVPSSYWVSCTLTPIIDMSSC